MKSVNITLKAICFIAFAVFAIGFTSCNKDDDEDDDQTSETSEDLSYVQVATGQTTLYDNDGAVLAALSIGESLYGQDANYLKGKVMSYEDSGDGIITDLNTELMWQQVPSADGFSWQEAEDYCENLELGGYDDWRMPSAKELYSISNFGSGWPYINTSYFTLASGQVTKDEQYWSSNKYVGTTVEGGDNAAFGVNHVTGHIKAYAAAFVEMGDSTAGDSTGGGTPPPPGGTGDSNPAANYVRAVRGDTYGINEFVDINDGTIIDNATALMWATNDNLEGIDWEDALSYAENSELAGYDDWRLPNVKELQGIVDYSYSPSATDVSQQGPAINPIFDCTAIVNEAGASDYAYYWTSTSANFTSGEPYYYAWYVAFGMAVNAEGLDFHGAGAVRFDTKYEGGSLGEGGERYYNYVRLVRNAN
jgi:hypothetical protein